MFGFCYLSIVGSSDRYKQFSCSKRSHSILEHNDVKYRVFSFLQGSEISTKSMLPATCSMQEKGTHALFIVSSNNQTESIFCSSHSKQSSCFKHIDSVRFSRSMCEQQYGLCFLRIQHYRRPQVSTFPLSNRPVRSAKTNPILP